MFFIGISSRGERSRQLLRMLLRQLTTLKRLVFFRRKKLEEYGARIVKPIKMYVKNEGLEDQVAQKRPTKPFKEKSFKTDSKQIIEIDDDEDDEFANGIDYDAIDLG
mmetsp:Transcript_3211/g.6925  ORF Transcript_3211/g.6925 Transcript_3211/m.6925 type:complete len:107 (+) Transcript_3211:1391-1711(+)